MPGGGGMPGMPGMAGMPGMPGMPPGGQFDPAMMQEMMNNPMVQQVRGYYMMEAGQAGGGGEERGREADWEERRGGERGEGGVTYV